MKRMLLIAAGLLLSVALGACSIAQQTSATAALAKLQTDVANGCLVVQPTLVAVAALDPSVNAVAVANGLVCATASSITVTSVQSLLSTGVPAIEKAVQASTLVPADQKPIVIAALGVFQLTAGNALLVFNQSTAASSTAASAPAAAAASATQ